MAGHPRLDLWLTTKSLHNNEVGIAKVVQPWSQSKCELDNILCFSIDMHVQKGGAKLQNALVNECIQIVARVQGNLPRNRFSNNKKETQTCHSLYVYHGLPKPIV